MPWLQIDLTEIKERVRIQVEFQTFNFQSLHAGGSDGMEWSSLGWQGILAFR